MGLMQAIKRMWRGIPHEPDAALAFDDRGFRRAAPDPFAVEWNAITKISGYRTDLWTVDEVRIDVELASGDEIFFSEESPGFPALMEEVALRFPTVSGWFERIALVDEAPGTIVLYDAALATAKGAGSGTGADAGAGS
jgi:hypothetical protein